MPKTLNRMLAVAGKKQANGLYDIHVHAWQNSNYLGCIVMNSGSPYNQVFTTVPTATPGTSQPCPEGEFDLGPLDWAGKKVGDYKTMWREIDSPIWVTIMRSRAIGFHLDGNRDRAPGSAGCLVFKDMNDLKKFVQWYNYGPFQKLYVYWGTALTKRSVHVKVPEDLKELARKQGIKI